MKIGLVLPSPPGYSETFFTNKVKGLQANGHEVVLFVNFFKGQNDFDCTIKKAPHLSGNFLSVFIVSLCCLLSCLVFHFKASLLLFRENRKDGISFKNCVRNTIINSHILSASLDWLHFGFGTMAIGRENVAMAIGAKMAVSFRGFDHYVYPIKHQDCYRILFRKEVKYHVLSQGMKNTLIENKISSSSIVVITPAINIDLFKDQQHLVKNTQSLEIVSVSRLHWIKGLEYTLQALALLHQQGMAFHYTIIGDGIEKERLQFAVHQLCLTENVTFAGTLAPEQVQEKLQQATLYLQYSLQEGFCNAVLEAQAMGKICIVSDAEGLTENILDGVSGFVVPKRNPEALARKIEEVILLPESEKRQLQKNAIDRVKTEFNLTRQQELFHQFYQ